MIKKINGLNLTYFPLGDQAIVAQFKNTISREVNQQVHSFSQLIKNSKLYGVKQLLPAFNNLTIFYESSLIGYNELLHKLKMLETDISGDTIFDSKTVYVPVVFGEKYGPDLEFVANHAGLNIDEVIYLLHSEQYYVYMVGAMGGFPYCGDIDERLSIRRRINPRVEVKKGSILIANQLTLIYTTKAPSGWHIVGWTPMETFNPYSESPSIVVAGDYIQYIPIKENEAENWNDEKQKEWDEKWH